jgi:hypothetical protein
MYSLIWWSVMWRPGTRHAILGESPGEPALVVLRHFPLPDFSLFDRRGGGGFRRGRFGLDLRVGNLGKSSRR